MDEKLIYKIALAKQMLETLETALIIYHKELKLSDLTNQDDHNRCDMFRDSVIQRFEYSVEHFWKFIETYLSSKLGIEVEEPGPKTIIRTAVLRHIIKEEEATMLFEAIRQRNKTSHLYKEEVADEVVKHAPKALSLMNMIVLRLDAHIRDHQ